MKTALNVTQELRESFQRARADIANAHIRCKPNSVGFTIGVACLGKLDRIRNHALIAVNYFEKV